MGDRLARSSIRGGYRSEPPGATGSAVGPRGVEQVVDDFVTRALGAKDIRFRERIDERRHEPGVVVCAVLYGARKAPAHRQGGGAGAWRVGAVVATLLVYRLARG
jgi:hypothetical protein